MVGGALLLSWAAFPDVEYLPEGNKARLRCKLYTPPGYNVDESNEIAEWVFQKFYRYWEVDPTSPAATRLDLPPLRDLLVLVRPGEIMVQVQTEDPRRIREWLPRLERLGQEIPDMRASAGQLSLFSRSSRKIDVEVTGPDVDSVIAHAKILQDRIEEVLPGVRTAAVPGLWNANPELHVEPRWNRLAEVGLDATQLGYVVDALTDGAYVASRIRPIFMTTGTTVLGLLPLVVMPGAGSELYRGLGCVVLGGLVVSTMLTLFLVPSFFSLVMETRERFRRRRTVDVPAAIAPAGSVEVSTEVAG